MFNVLTITLALLLADEPPPLIEAVTSLSPRDGGVVESVVYGQVVSVGRETRVPYKAIPGLLLVTVNVACTLTGPYDAASSPVLRASLPTKAFPGTLGEHLYAVLPGFRAPKPKAWVVARIQTGVDGNPFPWYVVYNTFPVKEFDRNGPPPDAYRGVPAIIEVKGFDDPKVTQIRARLARLRAEKPLRPWEAALQSIMAEWGNNKSAAEDLAKGGPARFMPPQEVLDFLNAMKKPTKPNEEGGGR